MVFFLSGGGGYQNNMQGDKMVQQNKKGSNAESWHGDGHFWNSASDPGVDLVPA